MSVLRESLSVRPPRPVHAVSWVARHPLGAFFSLAYAISWSLWLVGYAVGGGGMVLLVLGAFGPMAAAAIVTRASGESARAWLAGISKVRVPWGFYVYAIAVPIAVYSSVNVALALFGKNIDVALLPQRLMSFLVTLILVALLGGGQEEPGWRGFALPRLQAAHSPARATLILGFLWGLWHVPLYGPLGFVVPLLLAPFYSYLFNRTGSVIPCLLLHGSFTAAQDNLTLMANETHGVTDVAIGLSYLAGAVVLLILTRGRLGKEAEGLGARTPT